MATLAEVVSSFTPLIRSGNEWAADSCPFTPSEGGFRVIGERWLCVAHSCHDQHGDDALGFLRCTGLSEDAAREQLTNGHDWRPQLFIPEPEPGPYAITRLADRPASVVLITDSLPAAKVAARLLPKYAVMLWPGGLPRWELELLRGRAVLLWPQEDPLNMARLEAVLCGALGCTGKVVEGIALSAWEGSGEELVAAAKASKPRTIIINAGQTPAPQVASAPPSSEGKEAGKADQVGTFPLTPDAPVVAGPDEPPPSEFPPGALAARPRRRKPALRSVDSGGNAALAPEEEPLPHELSETGIAAQFVALHKDKFRTVFEWGGRHNAAWMVWNGARWQREDNRQSAMRLGQTLGASVKNWQAARGLTELTKLKFEAKKHIAAVLDLASYSEDMMLKPEAFDADGYLLGCATCTVDLRTGKAQEPALEDYITRACSVDPAPGVHPWWDRVIERISRGDESLRSYVQRWCGYLLIGGENTYEAFLFIYGLGASGKSKFITVLQEILGTGEVGYFRKADKEIFTHSGDKNTNIGEKIARLQGARLVTCSELEEGSRWKESLLKDFTGRERVEGRALYQATTEYAPTFKLIFSGNHKPALRSVGEEIKRRLHLLEFPGTIPEEDRITDLPDRLRAEYPAILSWMIEGALMVQEAGLGKPEQIIESTREYLTDEDTLSAWFEAFCEADSRERTLIAEAYKSYCDAAKADGEHYIISKKRFSQRMADKGYKSVKRGGGVRMFDGFKLKNAYVPPKSYSDT